jgi:hypothetical protein
MRRNGEAGVSRGTAPRLRNGIRLQADMRPARAALIDVYGLLPVCKLFVVLALRCNCIRISGFQLSTVALEP